MRPVDEDQGTGLESQRDELLHVAWTVAARDGLAACTYRGVAAEAGTSPTPFVRHFPTRESLLSALFDEVAQRFDADRGEAVTTTDPLESMVADGMEVLSGRTASRERNRISLDLGFHSLRDPKMRRRMKARDKDRSSRWLDLVGSGQELGSIREDRPAAEIADQLGSLLDGLLFGSLIYPRRLPAEHVQRLWDDGARRLVDPEVSPGVHQRLVIPEHPSVAARLGSREESGKRDELLAVAFRVTARDGLAGLSFRRLAEEAGTSTTPFTYAFGSRQRLLAAMVRATWASDPQVLELARSIPSPVDRFFAEWSTGLSDDPRSLDRDRVYYELHHEGLTNPDLSKLMREIDQEGFATTLPLIQAGRDAGEVRTDISADDLVDAIFALIDGFSLRRMILDHKRPEGYRVGLWEDGGRRMLAP